jgi:hypothetical protein
MLAQARARPSGEVDSTRPGRHIYAPSSLSHFAPVPVIRKSDFPAAALGFFGGAIVLALVLFSISRATSSQYARQETATQQKQN